MKLEPQRQSTTLQPMLTATPRRYLFRQLATVGLVVVFALCGMLKLELCASVTCQDDPPTEKTKGDAGQDDQAGSKEDPKSKDSKTESKKASSNRDVKSVQELNLPPAALKEVMKGTRSQREPAEELTIEKPLPAEKPTAAQRTRFNDLKKPQGGPEIKDEDLPLLDLVVKWQVYSMTWKDWFVSDGKKNRDDIEQVLENPGSTNPKFLARYKALLGIYLEHLLDNNLWVRINAMKLLAKVRDESTIPLFVQQIRDARQHDGVKYWAIKGIEYLGQRLLIRNVANEADAVGSLLDMMALGDKLEPFVRQACVHALGSLGRPTRVAVQKDTKVAVALLKIIRDPNIRRWDRSEAVEALAGLQIPPELDYNFQYVAYEIAQFAADAGAAALKDPALDDLHMHVFLVVAYESLTGVLKKNPLNKAEILPLAERAGRHSMGAGHGDPAYIRNFGDQLNKLAQTAFKVYKPGAAKPDDVVKRVQQIAKDLPASGFKEQLEELNELLKKFSPRSKKLSPDTEELGPPPALVGPKIPVAKETPEEEAKAKTEPAPGIGTGQSGP